MTPAQLTQLVQARHSCKAFDPKRQIPADQVEALLEVLRFAPSSVNSQPWHFFLADNEAGKAKLVQGLTGVFSYNAPKVQNASHVLVLCRRNDLETNYLNDLLEQEDRDGRFATPQAKEGLQKSRGMYADLHRNSLKDMAPWLEKQVYIALGSLLQSAAMLGIDACPMEGYDQQALDAALGLPEQGLSAVVLVALGYRSEQDFNATLPKSRFSAAQVITRL